MVKAQLYALMELNKSKHKCYVTDQILAEKGHTVLGFPLYHPDFTPLSVLVM
jgi:hypothetical protein